MTKLTYSEQLRHPNWQRRRLEALTAADWSCQACAAKDETLHVHHKQYFKGRMAWEYSLDELQVLCEACHQYEHDLGDVLKIVLARAHYPAPVTPIATGLMAGYIHGSGRLAPELKDLAEAIGPAYFQLGVLIHLCAIQGREKLREAVASFDIDPQNTAHQQLIEWLGDGSDQE